MDSRQGRGMSCSVPGYHEFFLKLIKKKRRTTTSYNFLHCVPKVSTIFFLEEQWVNQIFPWGYSCSMGGSWIRQGNIWSTSTLIFFWNLKKCRWGARVTDDRCNVVLRSGRKKSKETAMLISAIRTSRQTKPIIHAERLKKSVIRWAFKIRQSKICALKIRNRVIF